MAELRQAGLKYIHGQRAEARWKFNGSSGAATLDFYERKAALSDQLLRFIMEFRMGWQKVPYERCVPLYQSTSACATCLPATEISLLCISCGLPLDECTRLPLTQLLRVGRASRVTQRSRVMAQAGSMLMQASNSAVATVEQRHFLATAFNTHCASGPVIKVCETWVPPHVTLVCVRVGSLVSVGFSSLVRSRSRTCVCAPSVCASVRSRSRTCVRAPAPSVCASAPARARARVCARTHVTS